MTQANVVVSPLTLCEFDDPNIPGLESLSPYCLKAHRGLKVAGLSYKRRHGLNPREFKQYNPTGQVPVLLVGEEPVYDSTAILRRIQALAPGAFGDESDKRLQAEAWLWEEFADTSLGGFVIASRWADERNWPRVKEALFSRLPAPLRAIVPGVVRLRLIASLRARDVWRAGPERCWARFQETLEHLDVRAPEEGYWLGPTLTVADIGIFGHLHGLRNEVSSWQKEQIQSRARLSAYLDRVHARTSGAERAGATPSPA
jgi:glutathione S-transferase